MGIIVNEACENNNILWIRSKYCFQSIAKELQRFKFATNDTIFIIEFKSHQSIDVYGSIIGKKDTINYKISGNEVLIDKSKYNTIDTFTFNSIQRFDSLSLKNCFEEKRKYLSDTKSVSVAVVKYIRNSFSFILFFRFRHCGK